MPELSSRGEQMHLSPIRKLVPLANRAKQRGTKVYHLNIGQPDLPTPHEGLEALRHIDRQVLEYSPSEGTASLRAKMAGYYRGYGIGVDADDIIVTAGGSEALLFAFIACLNPGDELILPEPTYANYMTFATAAGVHVVTVPSDIRDGFALPPMERLEELITPRTRAILICNPNNPTGYVYSAGELHVLADLVKRHDLWLFSDEVYREFNYTGRPVPSCMELPGIEDRVVMFDSVSKRFSECGIRIGALVSRNERLRTNVLKLCQARLSPPLLGQIVAEASYDAPPEYMERTYNEYVARRDYMLERLNRIPGCYSPMPMGAFYTVASLPVDNADRFCAWCLEEFEYQGATVMLAPASGFYAHPERGRNQVRVAYVLCLEDLDRAMTVLQKALEAYPGRTEANTPNSI